MFLGRPDPRCRSTGVLRLCPSNKRPLSLGFLGLDVRVTLFSHRPDFGSPGPLTRTARTFKGQDGRVGLVVIGNGVGSTVSLSGKDVFGLTRSLLSVSLTGDPQGLLVRSTGRRVGRHFGFNEYKSLGGW